MSDDKQNAHHLLAQAAMVIGFNELAKQASTLGERLYFRLATAEAHEQFVALGGTPFLKSPHDVVAAIEVKPVRIIFRESDIEQMRQAVAEFDARNAEARS